MTSSLRVLVSAAGLAAAALLVAGCTATPGASVPSSSAAPSAGSTGSAGGDTDDLEGALLDQGRMFAVVTQGSSTCVPRVDEVTADGQTVSVTLMDPSADDGGDAVCTADFVPRASVGALPEGVDPTKEITLQVTYGDISDSVDLDGDSAFTGVPGESSDFAPSAGWYDDGGLVLLTWGSSSCAPIVESLEGSGATGTVTFVTEADKMCTMDMAPRATILDFGDDAVDDDGFTLALDGGGLSGTVTVAAS